MTSTAEQSRIIQAIDRLRAFDRREAANLLAEELRSSATIGQRWRSVAVLAAKIGEIEIAVEAARRYAATRTDSLDHHLLYWAELASHGRHAVALEIIRSLPIEKRDHPGILHFEGTLAAQDGDFANAEDLFRRALRQSPLAPQTWFALAMIKRFTTADPDLAAMQRLEPTFASAQPSVYSRFLYGLAKAWHDCQEYSKAFAIYERGAAIRRREEPFDPAATTAFVTSLITGFTPATLKRLSPSQCQDDRAIFVNGLPRSGTTLVEQIIASHSAVGGGAEVNLLAAALIPAGDFTFQGAAAYEQRSHSSDPWGELARDYLQMLRVRFQTTARVVDKTLCQSHLMGLLLHALPQARVIWLRRRPEDSAISTFRTYFTAPMPWSWRLEDIALFYREEDRLFQHWMEVAGDRILPVEYEDLVSNPRQVIPNIMETLSLPVEPGVFEPHKSKRTIRTASVSQVRSPVSTSSIGAAHAYDRQMDAFRKVYDGRR